MACFWKFSGRSDGHSELSRIADVHVRCEVRSQRLVKVVARCCYEKCSDRCSHLVLIAPIVLSLISPARAAGWLRVTHYRWRMADNGHHCQPLPLATTHTTTDKPQPATGESETKGRLKLKLSLPDSYLFAACTKGAKMMLIHLRLQLFAFPLNIFTQILKQSTAFPHSAPVQHRIIIRIQIRTQLVCTR